MVWCATAGRCVRAQGRQGAIRVETTGWEPSNGEAPTLPCAVDASTSGWVRRLTLPASRVRLTGAGRRRAPSGQVSLAGGELLVADEGRIETVVRFDGSARIDPPALTDGGDAGGRTPAGSPDSGVDPTDTTAAGTTTGGTPADGAATGRGTTVTFEEPTPVTLGFREPTLDPPTVTVPATPSGVATALTHAASALRTTGPERSHPGQRDHPPLIAFGDREVPPSVRRAIPETGIEFHLPSSLSTCCLAAPLAFYLGATVRTDDGRTTPVLRAPATGLRHEFPARDTPFADEAATLLRRVFLLDCLVRDRPAERLAGRGLLDRLDLEDARLRDLSPAERLTAYLGAPLDRLDGDLPAWPLATYVDGDRRTARCLPHLLNRLSLVHPAAASEADGDSLLRRALDGFYRGQNGSRQPRPGPMRRRGDGTLRRSAGDVATFDRLDPELRNAQLHGWLAAGIPVEAFKPTTRAYRNRLAASRGRDTPLDIAVICNDSEMSDERAVAEIYRDRAAGLPVDVSVHGSLSRQGLADLLATPHDFVHYIGHCERDGLRCRDGYLDTADLDTVRARTFFLNACGSYRQGQGLVEGGSVAGAVTLTTVLDRQAATVGTAFARLLIHGAGFERALSLARRQVLMGSDYAVVGDGTYALVPATDAAVLHVDTADDGFEVGYEVLSSGAPGRSQPSPFGAGDRLHGNRPRAALNRAALVELLRDRSLPVCYDERLCWSTALAEELAPEADDRPAGP